MFTKQLNGTPSELKVSLDRLALPATILAPDSVRAYALGHLPTLHDRRYILTLTVQSINNTRCTTMAGHLTVVVTELTGDKPERDTEW